MRRDVLFSGDIYTHFGDASHWLEPTRFLARYGRARGIEFHTDDMIDLESASVLVFGELPVSRYEVQKLRDQHPHLKLILHIVETPIGREWTFDPANHKDFDAVVSYNPKLNDGERYHLFRIPAGGLETFCSAPGVPWEERKTACMIANVPNVRPLLPRHSGFGMMRNGWKFNPRTWWNYITEGGSLYGERWNIARKFEEVFGEQFDIFGPGWPKSHVRGAREGFLSARGAYEGSKLDLLQDYRFTIAYENCRNDCGYISEKMFDALLGGCVPVYLGNQRISEEVPDNVFVDARKFSTRRELVEYVGGMPQAQWQAMRDAGADFIRTKAKERFGALQYAEAIVGAIQHAVGPAGASYSN